MKVRKENRVLTVDEADKTFYLQQGYDVVEFDKAKKEYEITETATGGKTYTIAEVNALKNAYEKQISELEAQLEDAKSPEMSRDEIKAALTEKGIEFKGNASTEDLKKLLEDSK